MELSFDCNVLVFVFLIVIVVMVLSVWTASYTMMVKTSSLGTLAIDAVLHLGSRFRDLYLFCFQRDLEKIVFICQIAIIAKVVFSDPMKLISLSHLKFFDDLVLLIVIFLLVVYFLLHLVFRDFFILLIERVNCEIKMLVLVVFEVNVFTDASIFPAAEIHAELKEPIAALTILPIPANIQNFMIVFLINLLFEFAVLVFCNDFGSYSAFASPPIDHCCCKS